MATTKVQKRAQKKGIATKKCSVLCIVLRIFSLLLLAAMITATTYNYVTHRTDSKEKVKVGLLVEGSSLGIHHGVDLAVKELGAKNVEIIREDSKCDPATVVAGYRKLVNAGVVAVIGDTCSSSSLALLPEANVRKVPVISPSASSPRLSIANDYFLRVVPSDVHQGEFLAKESLRRNYKRAAVFFTNEAYGSAIARVFSSEYATRGGIVESTTYADADHTDVETQVKRMTETNPDVIIILSNAAATSTAVIKNIRATGYKGILMGSDSLNTSLITKSDPSDSEGVLMSVFSTGSDEFINRIRTTFSTDEFTFSAQGYDAFHAIYLAIQSGAKNGEAVREFLPKVSFEGISAKIEFDEKGDLKNGDYPYDLLQVKNGGFVRVK